jgi:hypothetical protein
VCRCRADVHRVSSQAAAAAATAAADAGGAVDAVAVDAVAVDERLVGVAPVEDATPAKTDDVFAATGAGLVATTVPHTTTPTAMSVDSAFSFLD